MAAAAVQQLSLSADTVSISQSPDWRMQGGKNEKMSAESLSIYSTSSSRTLLSRCESRSPGYDFFSSVSKQEPPEKDLESTDASDVEGGDLLHATEKPVMRKSRAGVYVLERPLPTTHTSAQERPHRGQGREDDRGGRMERYSEATTDERESSFREKCNLSGDGPKNSVDNLNLFATGQTEKQKLNQNNQHEPTFKVDDSEPQSKNFDIELMYQKYNLDYSGDKKSSDQSEPKPLNKRQPSHTTAQTQESSELSDLAFRLRSNFTSAFLANELRPSKKPTPLDPTTDPYRALRTIDDILKEHGIPNKFPYSTSIDEPDWRGNLQSRTESINVSQNNETLPASSETPDKDIRASPNIRDMSSLPESTTSLHGKDTKTYFGHTSLPTSKTGFRMNLPQNVITGEDESLRRFGSSVDYSISGGPGKYSLAAKPSYGMSGYGKTATPFSGDAVVAPVTTMTMPDLKPPEEMKMNTIIPLSSKVEGSQVDLAKLPTEKETSFELIRSMGSATDALEFSMSGERERLRKLDTMITSTPFYSSTMTTPHRTVTNRFETPERDYTKFANDLLDRRVYSTATLPSSFGTGLVAKSSWSSSLGQRSRTNILEKSSSAPGFWSNSFHPTSSYSSSMGFRSPFWPYLSKRDYDVQYNNSTFTPQPNLQQQQAEKSDGIKTSAKNQKKTATSKKKTYGSGSVVSNSNQSQSFQVPAFMGGFLGNINDASKQRGNVAKSAQMKSSAGTKKPSSASNSKNTAGSHFDLCFIKDLDRMWQETVSGKPHTPNFDAKSPKFSQHKPYQPLQARKEDKSNMFSVSNDHARETRQLFTRICQIPSNRKPEVQAGTGGKYGGYESNLQPRQNSFYSEHPVKPTRNNQENFKRSANPKAKLKSTVTAANQRATMPKSILKQNANKSTNRAWSGVTKQQPAETSNTKSYATMLNQQPYTTTLNQQPYSFQHIYSPMSLYSLHQSYVPDFAKTAESPKQNKMAFDTYTKPCFNF